MSEINIKAIQADTFDNNVNDYNYASLSTLGQRYGATGDGTTATTFDYKTSDGKLLKHRVRFTDKYIIEKYENNIWKIEDDFKDYSKKQWLPTGYKYVYTIEYISRELYSENINNIYIKYNGINNSNITYSIDALYKNNFYYNTQNDGGRWNNIIFNIIYNDNNTWSITLGNETIIYKKINNEFNLVNNSIIPSAEMTNLVLQLNTDIKNIFYEINTNYSVYLKEQLKWYFLISIANKCNIKNNKYIVFPSNFMMEVLVDSIDSTKIYNTTIPITVKDSKEIDDLDNISNKTPYIIYDKDEPNSTLKQTLYNLVCYYNNDILTNIYTKVLSIMPYIGQEDNSNVKTWFIGNENTGISAMGVDAGQPNIIIIYTGKNGEDSKILTSNLYAENIELDYYRYTGDIKEALKIDDLISDTDSTIGDELKKNQTEFYFQIPKLKNIEDENTSEYLKNSLVISISDYRGINNNSSDDSHILKRATVYFTYDINSICNFKFISTDTDSATDKRPLSSQSLIDLSTYASKIIKDAKNTSIEDALLQIIKFKSTTDSYKQNSTSTLIDFYYNILNLPKDAYSKTLLFNENGSQNISNLNLTLNASNNVPSKDFDNTGNSSNEYTQIFNSTDDTTYTPDLTPNLNSKGYDYEISNKLPTQNNGAIIHKNSTILNRLNILQLGKNIEDNITKNVATNIYIGKDYKEDNPYEVVIGSNNINPNITNQLQTKTNRFEKAKSIKLDYNTLKFGNTSFLINGTKIIKKDIERNGHVSTSLFTFTLDLFGDIYKNNTSSDILFMPYLKTIFNIDGSTIESSEVSFINEIIERTNSENKILYIADLSSGIGVNEKIEDTELIINNYFIQQKQYYNWYVLNNIDKNDNKFNIIYEYINKYLSSVTNKEIPSLFQINKRNIQHGISSEETITIINYDDNKYKKGNILNTAKNGISNLFLVPINMSNMYYNDTYYDNDSIFMRNVFLPSIKVTIFFDWDSINEDGTWNKPWNIYVEQINKDNDFTLLDFTEY